MFALNINILFLGQIIMLFDWEFTIIFFLSLMQWSEESEWLGFGVCKPSDDLPNQEKNQYWCLYW